MNLARYLATGPRLQAAPPPVERHYKVKEGAPQPITRKQVLAVMVEGESITVRRIAERLGVADKPACLRKLREKMLAMSELGLVECVGSGYGKQRRDKHWMKKGD